MRPRLRRSSLSMVWASGVLAAVTLGCGEGTSTTSSGPARAGRGATLVGTLETGTTASEVRALSASGRSGIRVSVMGMSISTTTDESGRFDLTGLPSGRVELRIEGSFSSLSVGQRVEVEGRLLAGGAVLAERIEVED